MNQTKKLTQGAMMLAIVGALILIDRMSAYWFSELIVLIMPVIIIMYTAMHSFNDGLVLSVGMAIISFLLGNFRFIYLIYVPVGILTAIAYSYGLSKKFDKRTLLFIAILVYVVGEVIATFIIYPLLGFPINQMIEEFRVALGQSGSLIGFDYASFFSLAGLDFTKIILIIYIITTIFMGAMEGVLIHILTIFILRRFKILDLGNTNIFDLKPNKILSYICMLALFSIFLLSKIENEIVYYIVVTIAIIASMILMYYGYLFVILFGVMVLKRNVGSFFVLLAVFFPPLFVVLVFLGFLYGAGPLRKYLEGKAQVKS